MAKLNKWAITRACTYFYKYKEDQMKVLVRSIKKFKKKEKRSMLRNVTVNVRPTATAKPALVNFDMLTNF